MHLKHNSTPPPLLFNTSLSFSSTSSLLTHLRSFFTPLHWPWILFLTPLLCPPTSHHHFNASVSPSESNAFSSPFNASRTTYSTDFTKWDRFFISGWPALTLASPSLARAQARRDRRRIGCAQRMKWARAPTRFGPGKYTRPNPTWACTQYTVWRLTWMLWTMCHLAGLARLALGKTGRAQLDHIQHHLNSSELI